MSAQARFNAARKVIYAKVVYAWGDNMLLVSFLLEFIATTIIATVITAVVAVVVPRLEFLVVPLVIVVAAIIVAKRITPVVPVAFAAFVGAEAFYKRSVGKLQLSCRKTGQLLLDGVVVHCFLMPVVVG